jgi:hypothetical protein
VAARILRHRLILGILGGRSRRGIPFLLTQMAIAAQVFLNVPNQTQWLPPLSWQFPSELILDCSSLPVTAIPEMPLWNE